MIHAKPIEVKRQNWRVDRDGMLRVTANILKEGIFPYRPGGREGYPAGLAQKNEVLEFIPRNQFTPEALATLEGKPVVIDGHDWQGALPDDARESSAAVRRVGSVAGTPTATDDGYVRVDLLISDPEAVRRIQENDLIEVSAGYRSAVDYAGGVFDGRQYDGEQTALQFNHVAILPLGAGRCGRDVKILNKEEGNDMAIKINRLIGNSQREYVFSDDADAKTAERMALEIEESAAKAFEERVNAMESKADEMAKATEGLAEEKKNLEGRIAELEKANGKLLYLKENEQAGEEEAIIAEELNAEGSKEADEAKKDVEKANSLEERRAAVVRRVARMNGLDATGWTQDQVDANFAMLANRAKKSSEKRENAARSSKVEGSRSNAGGGQRGNARDRIAATQAAKNK